MLQLPRPYTTLRASLALQHMAYRVHALPRSLDQDSYPGYLTQFIKQFETTYKPFGQRDRARVIIFCRSKALVNSLFDALQPQAARFHSDLADDDRLSQLKLFRGDTLLLVATSGIGAGYDFPDVDLVIHFMPGAYEMTNFIQESGRAGRSPDRRAWSYCLVQSYQLQQPKAQGPDRPIEQMHFSQYLHDQVCRRRVISRVYDSKALESCDPAWAQCDLCTNRLASQSKVNHRVQQMERQNLEEIEFFARAVKYWMNERCIMCFIGWHGKPIPSIPSISSMPSMPSTPSTPSTPYALPSMHIPYPLCICPALYAYTLPSMHMPCPLCICPALYAYAYYP